MADIFTFPGGRYTENWLHAEGYEVALKTMPKQVAGEYGRGDFTLGNPFVPSLTRRQRDLIEVKIAAGTDYPSIVWLAAIPQHHYTDRMALHVESDVSGECESKRCCKASGDGITFDVVEQVFDNETLVGDDAPAVIGALGAVDGATDSFAVEDFARDVETGKTLLIGIRLLTPPNDGAENLSCTRVRYTPVMKVHSFEHPIQTM